jgi:hypothetical protein
MWQFVVAASDELADELGLEAPPAVFTPKRILPAIDTWLEGVEGPLDDEDAARLAALLGRLLVETHGGGLTQIAEEGHPLEGEWAMTDFARGLDPEYHVPFVVSAWRIGVDRSLTAADWYAQLLREGRAS